MCFTEHPAARSVLDEASCDITPLPITHLVPTATMNMLTLGVVANGRLEPTKLRNALEALARMGDWRWIGSRLHRTDKSKSESGLAVLTPKSFSSDCPAFQWHEQDFPSQSAVDVGVMPDRAGGQNVSFHLELRKVMHLYRPPCFPQISPDFLDNASRKDESVMNVSIVRYSDATLLGLTFPHLFIDAVGIQNVFSAWSKMVSGHSDDVPSVVSFGQDLLKEYDGEYNPDDIENGFRSIGKPMWQYLLHAAPPRVMWEMTVHREETRLIFLPEGMLSRLKAETNKEREPQSHEAAKMVSQADIVAALLMKCATLHCADSDDLTFATGFAVNVRGRIPPLPADDHVACAGYLGFTVVQGQTPATPLRVIKTASIATLARMYRAAIQLFDETKMVNAAVGTMRRATRNGQLLSIGKPKHEWFYITNWAAPRYAPMGELNWSAALEEGQELEGKERTRMGRVAFYAGDAMRPGVPRRFWSVVFGKDGAGVPAEERGVWVETAFSTYKWKSVEEYLESVSQSQ